jgi:hypothetical protein
MRVPSQRGDRGRPGRGCLPSAASTHQEIATVLSDLDATERRITELYTKAVEQLGSDKARSGSAACTHSNGSLRTTLHTARPSSTSFAPTCAYLRMPFSPPAPASKPEPEAAEGQKERGTESETGTDWIGGTWQQERQVRLTAQPILAEYLRDDMAKDQQSTDPPSSRFWNNIRLDLIGATLIDFNLVNGVMADANFHRAAFSGDASFDGGLLAGPPGSAGRPSAAPPTSLRRPSGAMPNSAGRPSPATRGSMRRLSAAALMPCISSKRESSRPALHMCGQRDGASLTPTAVDTRRLIQNPPLRDLARRPDLRIRELSILVGNSFE